MHIRTRLRLLRCSAQRGEQDQDEPDGRSLRTKYPYHAMTAFSANASPMIMMMSVIQSMELFRWRAPGESWVLIVEAILRLVLCRA